MLEKKPPASEKTMQPSAVTNIGEGQIAMRLLTEVEAAALLRQRPGTLRVWRSKRKGPSYLKIGRQVFYGVSDLDRWIQEQRVQLEEAGHVDRSRRNLVLPDSVQRRGVRKDDRTSGYTTKRQRREQAGSGRPEPVGPRHIR
jgi:hypothetical protein